MIKHIKLRIGVWHYGIWRVTVGAALGVYLDVEMELKLAQTNKDV